jgi:hypothetical protein
MKVPKVGYVLFILLSIASLASAVAARAACVTPGGCGVASLGRGTLDMGGVSCSGAPSDCSGIAKRAL